MDAGLLPLNPEVELFRWGPIPGKLFYGSDFIFAIFNDFPQQFGVRWPKSLLLFNDKGQMVWINEYPELRQVGEEVFTAYMVDTEKRPQLYHQWKEVVKTLEEVEEEIAGRNLGSMSDEEFLKLWKHFHEVIGMFWLLTIPQELGNYGSDRMLERALRAQGLSDPDVAECMEVLSAPESPSFYQQEEIDLVETNNLEDHRKKYFWLKNSYGGVEVLPTSFFSERKPLLPQAMRVWVSEHQQKVAVHKHVVITKFSLPESVKAISEGLCRGVEWQDKRKKYIFIFLHYKHLLIEEIAKRQGVSVEELLTYCTWEITDLLLGKPLAEPRDRSGYYGLLNTETISLLGSEKAREYWDIFGQEKIGKQVRELKGIVTSKGGGNVRGRVVIVLDPNESTHFSEGDVLVAPMTSPEYIFVMKKASAIITDTGGLMSHAAIISRELHKPCIVGTKFATQWLQNGDMVEVDTLQGRVTKIRTM